MARIRLSDVSLDYPIVTARSQSLRLNMMRVGSAGKLARDARGHITVTALDGVSLDARDGDRIALLGRNGAGKSTLLRVLAGIYPPTRGEIDVDGRISSVLGVSLPVDEELSGYEAVRYACIIRGLSGAQIEEVCRDVAEFTELGEYLNLPVRTYSSGMKVRLAFAVATHEHPDILVLDEGITAGDAFFLERSQRRAESFIDKANIIFLASHSEHLVRGICNKGILLDQGQVVAAGGIDELYEIYANIEARPGSAPVISLAMGHAPGEESQGDSRSVELFASESAPQSSPAHACDGCEVTYWSSAPGTTVEARAHIGARFPEPVEARTALIRQRITSLHDANAARSVAIEVSNDGYDTDIRRAAVVDLSATPVLHRIPLAPGMRGQWWRAILLSTARPALDAWQVARFDLLGDELPAFHAGRAESSPAANPGVTADHAFDEATPTPWVAEELGAAVEGVSWIGWDFGPAHRPTIFGVELEQWTEGARPNTVGAIHIECSEEAFGPHATELAHVSLTHDGQRQVFWLKAPRKARYWRIRAATGTDGGRWGIRYLGFLDRVPDNAATPSEEGEAGCDTRS